MGKTHHQTMYAHKLESGVYWNIYGSEMQVRMCEGRTPETIYKLNVREVVEGEESIYWGWQDVGEDKFTMVFPNLMLLKVCFPYGIEAQEDRGDGRRVNLIVEDSND